MDGSNFIFITGTGRSGTNILKDLLAKHNDVASLPFEHRFTVDPRGVLDFLSTYTAYWSPYWADHKIKDLEAFLLNLATRTERSPASVDEPTTKEPYADWELDRWIPGYTHFVEELIEALVQFRYEASWPGAPGGTPHHSMYFAAPKSVAELLSPVRVFIANCYNAICQEQDKTVFVEDNTHSLLFAKTLNDLFPRAKMIHMVRDPRDVIASLSKQRWAPSNIQQTTAWYSAVMHGWSEQKKQLKEGFFLEVKLEDLIRDKTGVTDQIGNFIGIELSDCAKEIDLSQGNVGRYQTDLDDQEIKQVTERVQPWLDEYAYT